MIDLTTYVYTLKALARIEKVEYGYLRVLLQRLQKAEKPLEWRDYRFVKVGNAKAWLAVPKDSDFEIYEE